MSTPVMAPQFQATLFEAILQPITTYQASAEAANEIWLQSQSNLAT